MNKRFAFALLASTFLANHLHAQHKKHKATHASVSSHKKSTKTQYGIASFYANKFEGRRTANGELFSQKKMTAASNTVPLNTWVKVTNLRNKKSVVVKITDRMYYRNKRLIDLSRSAAKQLGYTGWGLARVRVDIIGKHKPQNANGMAEK